MIVRAGDRGMVLGVTDTQVSLLAETPADELLIEPEQPAPRTVSLIDGPTDVDTPWRMLTETLKERTVRRS